MAAALAAAILILPICAHGISAEKAVLLDAQTGRILFEKKAKERALIASTTKIMTALIVCEQCNVLDRMRIPKEAVGIEGSSMYLTEGEVLTVQDLLYGLMLRSGNDAAVALAIYCGGTVEGFAELMNDKAKKLGLKNSHFENPHGLDSPRHYSTAQDMAVLAAYAMKNPVFASTVSTKLVTAGGRNLQNHNKILWRLEGADGVKTGYTKAAGRILVSSATRQGRRLIAVTMNAPDDWNDHVTLMEDGFQRYRLQQLVKAGDIVGSLEVAGGTQSAVELVADCSFFYPLTTDEQPEFIVQGSGFVYAPVVSGKFAGYMYICIKNSVIGKVPVVYSETVEQCVPEKITFWKRLIGGKTE
jgi:D-alanyl-D-alanine carboxypeptidase